MNYREAKISDIKHIQSVRRSVKENILSNPDLVTDDDGKDFITSRGKGWVGEIDDLIVRFAVADLKDDNIWALFLKPEFEGKGIGWHLHQIMLDWYFSTGKNNVWLGTTPNTRAESFYRKMGWKETGLNGDDEIKFEMTREDWQENKSKNLFQK